MPAFTPQPQSITALWLLGPTHFTVPRRVEGWVDLGGWLRTEIKCRLRKSNPDTVTHPSTNRAQRRLTSLIETNDATTTPRRHRLRSSDQSAVWVNLLNDRLNYRPKTRATLCIS